MSKKTVSFNEMGKDELRSACKAAGIKGYGKLSNLQMREALENAYASRNVGATPEETARNVVAELKREAEVQSAPAVTTPVAAEAPAAPAPDPMSEPSRVAAKQDKPAPAPKDSKNGITRPKAGSICAQVWDACDAILAAGPDAKVTFAALKEKLPTVNDSTVRTQQQRHRTYHK